MKSLLIFLILIGMSGAIPESPSLSIELLGNQTTVGVPIDIAFYYFPETSDIAHLTVTSTIENTSMILYDGIPNAYNGYTGARFTPNVTGKYIIEGNITFIDGQTLTAKDTLEVC